MGILINEIIPEFEISLPDAVVTVLGSYTLEKRNGNLEMLVDTIYRVKTKYFIYATQKSYNLRNEIVNPSKPMLEKELILNTNSLDDIFGQIYLKLKEIYPNGVNC